MVPAVPFLLPLPPSLNVANLVIYCLGAVGWFCLVGGRNNTFVLMLHDLPKRAKKNWENVTISDEPYV